jgi:hypothetical protein
MPELANVLGPSLNRPAPFDRRASVRYRHDTQCDAQALDNQERASFSVHVQNLSVGGLGLLADRRIEPHSLLALELPSKDECGSQRFVICVRSAEMVSTGVWRIGCEFTRPLTTLELQAVL